MNSIPKQNSTFGDEGLQSVTLRLEQSAEQVVDQITRISGLVRARNFIPVIDSLDLEANPRSAKVSKVTAAIIESIENTPEIFPLKTKGILIGATSFERLERSRIRLSFEQRTIEGILDGGHNTLAIGLYILSVAGVAESKLKRVKVWGDLRSLWDDSREEIELVRKAVGQEGPEAHDDRLDFLIPIELVVPSNPENALDVDRFQSSILEICEARNNNAELTEGAKGNKAGFYTDLRGFLNPVIADRIEWVPGTMKPVKVTDMIALAWLPLGILDPLPTDEGERPITVPSPQNLYRSKGDAIAKFNELMGLEAVTHERNGEAVLYNPRVRSALKLASSLPQLYDRIYKDFPVSYNSLDGKYGRIIAVAKLNSSPRAKHAKFTGIQVTHESPEGFIWPLVYGLSALMSQNSSGEVEWSQDPNTFLDHHFDSIVKGYKDLIQAMDFDPQKVGKAPLAYSTTRNAFLLASTRESQGSVSE